MQIFRNTFYLVLTNGINFILPIAIIPHLIKHIGIDNFGLFCMSQALASYMLIVTDYGFNMRAVQLCSIQRDNHKELQNVFNTVISTKLFLLLISFVPFMILINLYPPFRNEFMFFLFSFSFVIGRTLFPNWFYQGIENMKFIAYFNLLSKVILVAFIFTFINIKQDYIYLNILYGVTELIVSIISIILIYYHFSISYSISKWEDILYEIKNGIPLFITALSINTYVNFNVIILGFFTNTTIVGMYSVAEKITIGFKSIASVFFQAAYPTVCKLAEQTNNNLKLFLRKEFLFFGCFFLGTGIIQFVVADKLCMIIQGHYEVETVYYIKAFCFLPLIVSLNMPSYSLLVIYNLKKIYLSINLIGAFLCVILNIALIPIIGAWGTIISVIITELFIAISFTLYTNLINNKHRFLF